MSKDDIRSESKDLVAQYLAGGGSITKCPTRKAGGDGPEFVHTKEVMKDRRKRK